MKLKLSPAAIIPIAFFIWNKNFVKLLLSALLHELGHGLAAFIIGKRNPVFSLTPFGWSLYVGEISGRAAKIFVYAAGPFVSLLLIPVLSPQTLWILLFNLIPVLPLDGGRILSALVGERVALEIGGYALLYTVMLCFINGIVPVGAVIIMLLHGRYAASAQYRKIKRAADFLQNLY